MLAEGSIYGPSNLDTNITTAEYGRTSGEKTPFKNEMSGGSKLNLLQTSMSILKNGEGPSRKGLSKIDSKNN